MSYKNTKLNNKNEEAVPMKENQERRGGKKRGEEERKEKG